MMVAVEAPLRRVARAGLFLTLVIAGLITASLDPVSLLFFGSYAAIGAFLALRRPGNVIGWLLIGIAIGFNGTTTVPNLDLAALARGDATLRDAFSAWFAGWSGLATFAGFLALTILFPSGRLPEARGRRAAVILLVAGIADVVLAAIAPTIGVNYDGVNTIHVPNPVAVLPDLPFWSTLPIADGTVLVVVALLVIGVVRMTLRFRRATGIERLQLRWLVAAVAFVVIALVSALASIGILGDGIGTGVWIPVLIAYPTIPLAIGVAVMRYRLLEIDRIISRTLSWAIVSGILVTAFAGGVVALQAALAGFTQGQTLAVAGSTLVAFALFQPVRRRVQSVVDRRFDRARYDAQRTVDAFAQRLRDETDMEKVTNDLSGTASSTVAPASLAIWLRARGEGQ